MIDKDMLKILACPDNRMSLAVADKALLDKVNEAIGQGRIASRGGRLIEQPLQEALVREDHVLIYPIIDGIPVLLPDEAILLGQVEQT